MQRNWRAYTVVVVVSTLLLVGYVGAQNAGQKPKAVSIAVVDVSKLLFKLEEKTQIEADMKDQQQTLNKELASKRDAIKKLEEGLVLVPKGTPAYVKKMDTLDIKKIELSVWTTYHQRKMERRNIDQTEELYKKMIAAIEQAGKSGGYDLILFKERPLNLKNIKPSQVSAVLRSRKVIYASDKLDITDKVSLKMNNDYKNGK